MFTPDDPSPEHLELMRKIAGMSVWTRTLPDHVGFTTTIEQLQAPIADWFGVDRSEVSFGYPERVQEYYQFWKTPFAVAGAHRGFLRSWADDFAPRSSAYERVFEVDITHDYDITEMQATARVERWFKADEVKVFDQVEEDPPPGYQDATSIAGRAYRDGLVVGTFHIAMPVILDLSAIPKYAKDVKELEEKGFWETDAEHVYEVRLGAPGVLLRP